MSVIRHVLFITMVLAAIMVFLTYTPSDSRYFWTYWVSCLHDSDPQLDDLFTNVLLQFLVFTFLFFGFLMDRLFNADLSFVFDPNPENWRRKVDPQS